jgi:hypothetical protein
MGLKKIHNLTKYGSGNLQATLDHICDTMNHNLALAADELGVDLEENDPMAPVHETVDSGSDSDSDS